MKIKLPFKSSPQAIRADPPCRTRRRTKPSPDEKKKNIFRSTSFSTITLFRKTVNYVLCLGIGDRERVQSLPVPSHYCLFIDSPQFTLSTIL
jgi:hypothetical protein